MTALCNTLLAQLAQLLLYPIHIEDSVDVLHTWGGGGGLKMTAPDFQWCIDKSQQSSLLSVTDRLHEQHDR